MYSVKLVFGAVEMVFIGVDIAPFDKMAPQRVKTALEQIFWIYSVEFL